MDDWRSGVAREAATAGGDVALELFRADLDVETKDGKTDVVTQADVEAQRRVAAVIREHDPDAVVVGEEGDAPTSIPATGPAWVVDPIDGTHNYVAGIRRWATSVAALTDGEPVAAANVLPALDDTYVADSKGARRNGESITVSERSDPDVCTVVPTIWWNHDRREEYATATTEIVRRFGDLARFKSAQATLSLLASGAVDGTFSTLEPHPWDTVAGVYLVRQAGGRVTDLSGERWTHDSVGLVASNGPIHDRVLAAAQATADAGGIEY